jgi:hypothetical protein
MPIIYQHQPDESMTWATLSFEEDGSWWSSVQKCGATIALAAVLATTGASTAQATQVFSWQQDEAPISPIQDEDFWQNPAPPIPATFYQKLPYLPDPEEIPAGSLSAVPDEVYWQLGPSPVPATLLWTQQWTFDEQIPAGSLAGAANEEYWLNLPVPFSQNANLPAYWFDANDIFQQAVVFQPDEDYWQNPVAPVPATLLWMQQWTFDEQITSSSFTAVPEETYWFQAPPPTNIYYLIFPYFFDAADFGFTPVSGKQNYINTGTHNFVSQDIGSGIEY